MNAKLFILLILIFSIFSCSMNGCKGGDKLPEGYDPYSLKKMGYTVINESDEHISYLTLTWMSEDEVSGELYISYDITGFSLKEAAGSDSRLSLYATPDGDGTYKLQEREESFSFWSIINGEHFTGHASLSGDLYDVDPAESFIWKYYQEQQNMKNKVE